MERYDLRKPKVHAATTKKGATRNHTKTTRAGALDAVPDGKESSFELM